MVNDWFPIPHTWREAVYLAVAIILATTYKRIQNGVSGFVRNFRLAPAQADKIHAEAQKIRAEADSISTHDAMGVAQLMREMTTSMAEAKSLEDKLKEKLASQASQINLLTVERDALKSRNAELEDAQAKKA